MLKLAITIAAVSIFSVASCGDESVEILRVGKLDGTRTYTVTRYTIVVAKGVDANVRKSGDERVFGLYELYAQKYAGIGRGKVPVFELVGGAEKPVDYFEMTISDSGTNTTSYVYLKFVGHRSPPSDMANSIIDVAVTKGSVFLLTQETNGFQVNEYKLHSKPVDGENIYGASQIVLDEVDPAQISVPKIVAYPNGIVIVIMPYRAQGLPPEGESKIMLLQKVGKRFVPISRLKVSGEADKPAKVTLEEDKENP